MHAVKLSQNSLDVLEQTVKILSFLREAVVPYVVRSSPQK